MTFYRSCILLLTLIFTSSLAAQAPKVLSVSPKNMAIANPTNFEIQIDFDQELDLTTVDFTHFKVTGRWTGPHTEIAFSMDNDNKTVRILLDTQKDPFNAGEWVTVYLTKGIKALNGAALEKGYVWNFWIATQPGFLSQKKIKIIPLRQPGEGLLQAYGAYAGDLNNDGFTDLTVVDETADDLRILLNDGTGDYQVDDMTILPMGNASPSPNEGGDFNGDGFIDLAVCTAHDAELRVLFGDGDGSFYQQDNYTTGTNARGLVVMDYNGDGAEDIVIANRGSNNINLFTNDGSGVFNKSTVDLDPLGFGESGLVAADINNDGIQDLFVGNYISQEIVSFLGDGDGGFVLLDKVSLSGTNQPWMLCTGDFNADGFADIASANSTGNSMTVHFNDGTGKFANQLFAINAPQGLFPLAIDAGDLDGDGDLDLVTSNYESATYTVFENDGTGDFGTSITTLLASDKASCAILHDRDNDGDLDISATDEGLDHLILFENALPDALVEHPEFLTSISVSPNPFSDYLLVDFELESTQVLQIRMVDIQGKYLRQLWSGKLDKGSYQIPWDGRDENGKLLPDGLYGVQFSQEQKTYIKSLIKVSNP